MSARRIAPAALAALILFAARGADQWGCPDNVRPDFKRPPVLYPYGAAAVPVTGWIAYQKTSTAGVWWSRIESFAEKLVPGTDGLGKIGEVQISDDGRWILFEAGGMAHLVRPDGTGLVSQAINGTTPCFYRRGPKDREIAYRSTTDQKIYARAITLGASSASFGAGRTIAEGIPDMNGELAVNGNHIYVRRSSRHLMVTIPDGGNGTATTTDWYDVSPSWNCGLTLSPDGSLACNNTGGPACLDPYSGGHKGFLVLPFRENTAAKTSFDTWAFDDGISLNWVPEIYNGGSKTEQEFHHWYWSNDDEWIAGVQRGSKASLTYQGVYLVHYATNEWFQLTPSPGEGGGKDQVAAFVDPGLRISSPERLERIDAGRPVTVAASLALTPGAAVGAVDFYGDGQLLGTDTQAPYTATWAALPAHAPGSLAEVYAVARNGSTVLSTAPRVSFYAREPLRAASLDISDSTLAMGTGETQPLKVDIRDQYGDPLPATLAWNAGSGAVGADQIYRAGTEEGQYLVIGSATHGGATVSDTLRVRLVDLDYSLIKVNFTKRDYTLSCDGYLVENVRLFGRRESGFAYGWAREIGPQYAEDPSYGGPTACWNSWNEAKTTWTIQVPNGTYELYVVMKEGRLSYGSGEFRDADLTPPPEGDKWRAARKTVAVSNGTLDLRPQSYIPKICLLELKQLTLAPTSAHPAAAGPTAQAPRVTVHDGRVAIAAREATTVRAALYSVDGRLIARAGRRGQGPAEIALRKVPAGAYVLRIEADGTRHTCPVTVAAGRTR